MKRRREHSPASGNAKSEPKTGKSGAQKRPKRAPSDQEKQLANAGAGGKSNQPKPLAHTFLKPWHIGDVLGFGSFGTVYEAYHDKDLEREKPFALKASKILPEEKSIQKKHPKTGKIKESEGARSLSHERTIYTQWLKGMQGTPDVDMLRCYGEVDGYRYLVLEKLGPSLEKFIEKRGPLPEDAVLTIGHQMLQVLKVFHRKGWVYVDLKPENIMLGLKGTEKEAQAHLVDYGCSMRYRGFDAAEGGQQNGTPNYISNFAHQGANKHPRNDLQSLAYVLIDIIGGNLPWKHAENEEGLINTKRDTPVSELVKGIPEPLAKFTKYVYDLDSDSKVDGIDYDYLLTLFPVDLEAVGSLHNYDWTVPKKGKQATPTKKQKSSHSAKVFVDDNKEPRPPASAGRKIRQQPRQPGKGYSKSDKSDEAAVATDKPRQSRKKARGKNQAAVGATKPQQSRKKTVKSDQKNEAVAGQKKQATVAEQKGAKVRESGDTTGTKTPRKVSKQAARAQRTEPRVTRSRAKTEHPS